MKKTLCLILTVLILLITLTGCKKCISKESEYVPVKIVDTSYYAGKLTSYKTGIHRQFRWVPSRYYVIVKYNSKNYTFDNSKVYKNYHNKKDSTAKGTLVTKKYDDGSIKTTLVSIGCY